MHKVFVPSGQVVNGMFYCEILRRLVENVRCKWPEISKNGDWLLHHDNAPAHTSLFVREFLINNNMTTVPHPAYSPDLVPCDFYMFPKLKLRVKGWHFLSTEEIQAQSQRVLNTLTRADFNHCFTLTNPIGLCPTISISLVWVRWLATHIKTLSMESASETQD